MDIKANELAREFKAKFTQFVADNAPSEWGESTVAKMDGVAASLHLENAEWDEIQWALGGEYTVEPRDGRTGKWPQLWGDRRTGLLMGSGGEMPSVESGAFWMSDDLNCPDTDCWLDLATGEFESDGVEYTFEELKFDWAAIDGEHLYISFEDDETTAQAARAMLERDGYIAACAAWAEGHCIASGDKILGNIGMQYRGRDTCKYWSPTCWGASDEEWNDNWIEWALEQWAQLEQVNDGMLSAVRIGIGVDGDDPEYWNTIIEQGNSQFSDTIAEAFAELGIEVVMQDWMDMWSIREQVQAGDLDSVDAFREQMKAVIRDADEYGDTRADIRLLAGEGMI